MTHAEAHAQKGSPVSTEIWEDLLGWTHPEPGGHDVDSNEYSSTWPGSRTLHHPLLFPNYGEPTGTAWELVLSSGRLPSSANTSSLETEPAQVMQADAPRPAQYLPGSPV